MVAVELGVFKMSPFCATSQGSAGTAQVTDVTDARDASAVTADVEASTDAPLLCGALVLFSFCLLSWPDPVDGAAEDVDAVPLVSAAFVVAVVVVLLPSLLSLSTSRAAAWVIAASVAARPECACFGSERSGKMDACASGP